MPLIPGDIVQGRYRIDNPLIAQGGMSAVYRAWDMRLDKYVALKEMAPYLNIDEKALRQLREQFLQEAQVLAKLKHNNLTSVIDQFEDEGNVYLIMDFVEGPGLDELIAENNALPQETILPWARELIDALKYCHEENVIHRDVKPQNVIITPEDNAVLVDFGLVKVMDWEDKRTKTVMRGLGTPEYAPPEQYDAETGSTDERTDVYALGATLYHALTGTPPPTATQRIVSPQLLKPVRHYQKAVSVRVEKAISKALSLQPQERFQTMDEMAEALFEQADRSAAVPLERITRPLTGFLGALGLSGLRSASRLRLGLVFAGVVTVLVVLLGSNLPLGADTTATPTMVTPSLTPTFTLTPTGTATSTATSTPTSTSPPTDTPTSTVTNTPTNTPTDTPWLTSTSTGTPVLRPTLTHTPTPSVTPTRRATSTPTPTPTWTPTNVPVRPPTNTPTRTWTPMPTNTPTNTPTDMPTLTPSNTPTNTPIGRITPTYTFTPVP
jgi:serine/threonine-protein kinase